MLTLIVGMGALGGTIAARAICAGMSVRLATRTTESARRLRASGLRVSGVGGPAAADRVEVAAIEEYAGAGRFDLILLATKAHEALEISGFLSGLLAAGGTLLPIQNGGVSQILCDRLGERAVIGGLSNLGATMVEPGVYQQRNAGHLLVGELAGGMSERAANVARALSGAVETRVTPNLRGAAWAKLLLNCSVTTVGAIAGQTMRRYMMAPAGRQVFRRAYDEALSVAVASGNRPERMIVDPVPPAWEGPAYDGWIQRIVTAYGDLKPSMLQDIERGRRTEIDFINGHVAAVGRALGVAVTVNEAITAMVHRIERGELQPDPTLLQELLSA